MIDLLAAMCLNAAFWGGTWMVVARWSTRERIDDILATLVVGFATIVVALEILGFVGQIRRGPLAVICLVSGALGLWCWRGEPRGPRPSSLWGTGRAFTASWSAAPAIIAVWLATWAALLYLLMGLTLPVEPVSDAPIYHLPLAIRWWRSGSLNLMPTPFGDVAATYFPANGELWLTWLMATGFGATVVKVGQWPFMLVGALALYGVARRVRVPWAAAVFPAALWIGLPLVLTQSNLANVDLIWGAFYLVAVYCFIRWMEVVPATGRQHLFLGALACGIVIGAKAVGAVFVAVLLVPLLATLRRRPAPARDLALLAAGLLVPSGYWYLRNIWIAGNPLYPLQLSLFGQVLAEGWYPRAAMDASAYHIPVRDWRVLVARLVLVCGASGAVLAVAGLCAGWVQARRSSAGSFAPRVSALCASLAVAHLIIYWCVVPYNTQERFIVPALGLALVPLSALCAASPFLPWVCCGLLGWQLLGFSIGAQGEWVTLLRLFDNPLGLGHAWASLALPASIAAAAVVLHWAPRWRMGLACAVVLVGCYTTVQPASAALAERPLLRFYPRAGFASSLLPGWEILERRTAPAGSAVAYTGTNLPYYLYGSGLRNTVQYVNVNSHPGWLLHEYHRALVASGHFRPSEDPYPQWHRAERDFGAWAANLRAGGIDFVFIARENRHGYVEAYPGVLPQFPIERTWADTHPELFEDLGPFQYAPGTIPWVRVYRFIPGTAD